jgi:uncharacterized protein YdaU (DUF1376 family)
MKWFKFDPHAFLEGTLGLDAEERGFYVTLLCLLYARDGEGVTDELVCKAMGCRPQVWRRVKTDLIGKGKVREVFGKLTANRVETELHTAHKLIEKMSYLGKLSAAKRLQNNELWQRLRPTATDGTTTTRKNNLTNGESQQPPPPVEKAEPPPQTPQPPQSLADLNHRMGWSPAGTRKPFT